MLFMSNQNNNPLREVDMNVAAHPYKLRNRDLLKLLMEHTGAGTRVTTRGLATAAGCAHGTIGNLLTGVQDCVPLATASRITQVIGVDLLVLFTPTGRSVPAQRAGVSAIEAVPA